MKHIAFTLFALFVAVSSYAVNIKPITQVNDINKVGDQYYDKQVKWTAGDSIRFDVFARDGRDAVDFSGNLFPVLYVAAETNLQDVYIIETGTVVDATNGHVRVQIQSTNALLDPDRLYSLWMTVYRGDPGTTAEVATVANSALTVLASPIGSAYLSQISVPYTIIVSGITTEADNVFTASVAAAISSTLTGQWSQAYAWGNAATQNLGSGWSKFPATQTVDMAQQYATNLGGVHLDLTPSGSIAPGRMQWNPDMETVRLGLDAAVSLDVGQQQVAFVRNAESVTISNGTVVYISGATGDKATVKVASYSNDTLSARTIGIAAEDIVSGGTGFVVTRGPVYAQKTDTFTQGAMLYLGAYGNVITNRPSAPLHGVFVGVVEKVNANAGVIYVAVQNGFEMDELHDVNVSAPVTNDLLIYNGTVWTNYPRSNLALQSSLANYLPLAGGTVTGPITNSLSTSDFATALFQQNSAGGIRQFIQAGATTNNPRAEYVAALAGVGSVQFGLDPDSIYIGRQDTSYPTTNALIRIDRVTGVAHFKQQPVIPGYLTVSAAASTYATGSPLYEVDLTPYATGTPLYAVDLSAYATGSPLYEVDFTPYATGTPLYAVDLTPYATGSPLYSVDLTPYATGTPLYAYGFPITQIYTDTVGIVSVTLTNQLYVSDTNLYWLAKHISTTGGLTYDINTNIYNLTGWATGTPLYAESDPIWLSEKSNYATGTPIYSVSGLATGVPLYAYTETDTIATNALANYLPLAGGTISGSVNATSLTVSNPTLGKITLTDSSTKGVLVGSSEGVSRLYFRPADTNESIGIRGGKFVVRNIDDNISFIIAPDGIYDQNGNEIFAPSGRLRQPISETATLGIVTAQTITATSFIGSFIGNGSSITNLTLTGYGLATGTPLYVETDPIWTAASSLYYTAAQVDAAFATGTPLYSVDLSAYATGTPLYTFTETDPIWTAASTNYYTSSQADALFATGAPLYSVDLSAYATGSPLYVYTETDSIATNLLTNYYTSSQADALFATGAPLYSVDLTSYITNASDWSQYQATQSINASSNDLQSVNKLIFANTTNPASQPIGGLFKSSSLGATDGLYYGTSTGLAQLVTTLNIGSFQILQTSVWANADSTTNYASRLAFNSFTNAYSIGAWSSFAATQTVNLGQQNLTNAATITRDTNSINFNAGTLGGTWTFNSQPSIPGYLTTNGSAANLVSFPSSLLTVSAGNTNYLRHTTANPTNATYPGQWNQFTHTYRDATSIIMKVYGPSNKWYGIVLNELPIE